MGLLTLCHSSRPYLNLFCCFVLYILIFPALALLNYLFDHNFINVSYLPCVFIHIHNVRFMFYFILRGKTDKNMGIKAYPFSTPVITGSALFSTEVNRNLNKYLQKKTHWCAYLGSHEDQLGNRAHGALSGLVVTVQQGFQASSREL